MSAGRCHHQDRVSGKYIIQPNSWGWWERLGASRGAGHRFSLALSSEEPETPAAPRGRRGARSCTSHGRARSFLLAEELRPCPSRASRPHTVSRAPAAGCWLGAGRLSAPHAGGELKAAHTRPGEGEQPPRQHGASSPRHAAPPHAAWHTGN